jgi:hypothetical protein
LQSPVRSWKFYDVIPEIEIWRAATLMLKRYGERAIEESAARADELASAGDDNGVPVWRRCRIESTAFPGRMRRRSARERYRSSRTGQYRPAPFVRV